MTAPTTATPEQKPSGDFSKRVNYSTIYANLRERGITFTQEEEKKFEEICNEQLGKYNGELVGNNLGASGQSLVYMLFAFIQNLFNGGGLNDLSNIGNAISGAGTETSEQTKLWQLNQATIGIYNSLAGSGGNLARAAELVTGQKPVSAQDQSLPVDMNGSIFNQLVGDIRLPANTPTSLNERMSGNFTPPPHVSGSTPTQALTRRS